MAKPYRKKGSKFWYIAPTIQGQQRHQSSKTTDYEKALARIKILEGQLAQGIPIQPQTDRKDVAALLALVRTDYKVHERRSLRDLERRIDMHLSPALGHLPSNQIALVIDDYVLFRRSQAAANGSIEQELAILRRAFRLGKRKGIVMDIPYIERLPKAEPRSIAFSNTQITSILGKSDELLTDILTLYSFTGWRRSSVFLLEWSQIDFLEGFISLRAEQTKNRKATRFPLIEPLRSIFERRHAETRTFERAHGRILPWVFHRNGVPVKSIRKAFEKARLEAGLPGHRIHDFRRTAVRALHDLGYDVKTIMDMCGFKTEAMVHRYIGMTSDDRLREAGKALAQKRGFR
jgi:integrase